MAAKSNKPAKTSTSSQCRFEVDTNGSGAIRVAGQVETLPSQFDTENSHAVFGISVLSASVWFRKNSVWRVDRHNEPPEGLQALGGLFFVSPFRDSIKIRSTSHAKPKSTDE
jgi:hypothetical protein